MMQVQEEYNKEEALMKRLTVGLNLMENRAAEEERILADIERIQTRLNELITAHRYQEPVTLRRHAEKPKKPSMPRWEIMVPLGVFLGLLIGLALIGLCPGSAP